MAAFTTEIAVRRSAIQEEHPRDGARSAARGLPRGGILIVGLGHALKSLSNPGHNLWWPSPVSPTDMDIWNVQGQATLE
ncbi:hypothetical protein BGW80DRAFT_599553 [Lactifluus volemus]|nr:hypothetical protein BGW80DRAFT_599553 [Lactifluus volemus]